MPAQSEPSSSAPAPGATPLQLAIVVAIIVGYAALSHYSNSAPDAKGLGTGLSLAPLLLIGGVFLWRWSQPVLACLIFVLAGLLLYRFWPILTAYYEWSDLVQQCGAYALISMGFGRSLFVNFYSFGIIGLTFIVDHVIRRCVLPPRPRGILAAVRQSLGGSN